MVHGLLVDRSPELAMGLFDLAWVGVPGPRERLKGGDRLVFAGTSPMPFVVALTLIPVIWPF
ncbi:hypothetical protein ACM26W_05710 [Halomonas sp. HK25]|uniref:hypothetical protein n=1 Tax=Halomonas sp. HK25 TaxID=3394321 RepID=UPI0039FBBBF0